VPNSHTEVYIHYVWATWDRDPLISDDIEKRLHNCIRARCRDLQAHVHAVNGMPDHVHLVIRLPATLSIAEIAGDIKGASSHFATHVLGAADFKWQGAYYAEGVCRDALDTVIAYVENQKKHHQDKSLRNEWELPPA
jgi:putative transposase